MDVLRTHGVNTRYLRWKSFQNKFKLYENNKIYWIYNFVYFIIENNLIIFILKNKYTNSRKMKWNKINEFYFYN